MPYTPPQKILDNYADVLVNFALGNDEGIKSGDVVQVAASESAKPLYAALLRAITKAGGHAIGRYLPDEDEHYRSRDFFAVATDKQLDFFPDKYYKSLINTIDHQVGIISETDKRALEKVSPSKIMRRSKASKSAHEWMDAKENAGQFTWTLALYGTPAMAKEVGLSEEEYWQEIIKACFLDEADPIKKWREVAGQIDAYKDKLNKLDIKTLHIEGKDIDLTISMGEKRLWAGGGGRNIPSFEIFTSPDWRGTNGRIRFSEPLYRYGNVIEGIELEFKDGLVVKSSATKNEAILKEMIATENADKIGEFSLTDRRFSRITKFMAETLFDENVGGEFGNTHIALGKSYHNCYDGDPSKLTATDWAKLGYNDSVVHTDMVSTTDRTVTATLQDGTKKIIYKSGQFRL